MRYTPFHNHFNMEKHCTMVYFSLRESKQNKKGLSPIEVSISTNGKRIYFSTNKYTVQQKPPSYYRIHKKKGQAQCTSPPFIYSFKLEFFLCDLFSCFFKALSGSTISLRLMLRSSSRRVKNNWFSLLEDCLPLYSCSIFNFLIKVPWPKELFGYVYS